MGSRVLRTVIQSVALIAVVATAQADWNTNKFQILLSATETKGGGDTNTTLSWSLDGGWDREMWDRTLQFTLDSDYSKSDSAKLDRLRTGTRLLDKDYGKVLREWSPVYLIQTEGDHSLDSVHTLVAAGFRQKRRYGFLEATAGVSKDIQTSESWVGDIGFEVGLEKQIGSKWKVRTGPKGEYGALGSVRLRDDRFRYSWDVNVDYQASERLGVGYRLWYGNTVPNSDRTQWIGLTYRLK